MPDKPNAPPVTELWSNITPNDLGLKAAYWTHRDEDPVRFVAIVGWVTWSALPPYDPNLPARGFFPVVVDPTSTWPHMAKNLQDYLGVVPNDWESDAVKERARAVKPEHAGSTTAHGEPLLPNVGHVGKA